jgi:two-component system cell cycle response regulator DivK
MRKILIVEDTEFNLDLLIQLLEDDYELICAGDGEAGMALAEMAHPDLILMDMSLPVMDGWTAATAIKSNPTLSSIPIIGLSAHAMEGDQRKAIENGCDAYLTKPVDEVLLRETLDKFLKDLD